MVFSGGVALGAYHAGAYACLEEQGGPDPDWVAGASVGAVTAAIIAGNPAGRRSEHLRRFWDEMAYDPAPWASLWLGQPGPRGPWRKAQGWAAVLQLRLSGHPRLFVPHLLPWSESRAPGLYDLKPLRRRLEKLVDFDLLNSARAPRLSTVATDLSSGERVICDTRHGTRIGQEHILASCALPPDFAPIEIDGRLLGDGGLSTNAPVDLVLDDPGRGERVCFVLDLFSKRGRRPASLAETTARAVDLVFSGQTGLILDGRQREHRLRALIAGLESQLPDELRQDPAVASVLQEGRPQATTVLHLSYGAPTEAADMQKTFDFSPSALTQRWQAGARDMRAALQELPAAPDPSEAPGFHLRRIPGDAT
nr:patatin-like phospholipase family protein [Pararoseomonas indoligenes]